ncbi:MULTISPECIES: hypothetical protein [unclassified Enterococcus]|uniref:hypothetical protein n=1 Tax=unclassified Enterococcus TaxID=2608891 RepID=UPI001558021B|nr:MULTISPECIES: hypothetical protein [unclassified Enterococcus]MBS7577259.1 hypothetical protein [Enterococcus sp. MMGLQ5-2]MBS7584648.1 hypothetical protein [Enterococcus sp. MMGLQ5-1]NPD12503.1 hypothetical protein [Enterococcus sp. MMGLQ5-1]NPD37093.1 hypothetical protein [Enterococcus sp. MMGLQ5-2]
MKKIVIICGSLILAIFIIFIGWLLLGDSDTGAKKAQKSSESAVSSSIIKDNSSSSQSKAASSEQISGSTNEFSDDPTEESIYQSRATEDAQTIEAAGGVDKIAEARKLLDQAGMDSNDFSNLDIANYINAAKENNMELVEYLKSIGF